MKNNISPERKLFLKKQKNNKIFIITFQVLLLLLFFSLWELLTHFYIIDPFYFSSPSRIVTTIVNLFRTENMLYHIGITLYEAFLGFAISMCLGFIIAVILWWSETVRKILDPYIVVLNSLPKIALGPVIIIWFGAGTKAIVVMAILILIVITILSILSALLACDQNKILLLKSMGATKLQILFKLVLPNAFPEFISILKINVGMTWVGVVMGEYLVSGAGLGYLIVYGGQIFKLDLVMASTLILCILAGGMYAIVALIEKRVLKNTRR